MGGRENLAIVLGASNVANAHSALKRAVEQVLGASVDLRVECGNGRGYAVPAARLWKTLPAIVDARLWRDLARPELPGRAFALVTDVGNDLIYGASVEQTLAAVGTCLERLERLGAHTLLAGLPLASLPRLGGFRYLLTTKILGLDRAPAFEHLLELSTRLDTGLRVLGRDHNAAFVEPSADWYGIDPIHLRRARRTEAFRTIVSHWSLDGSASHG
jgi:hypothetical protein